MSNGARLTAVIVVVAVAAIGLYFAFMTPSKKDASVQDPLAADGSIAVIPNPGELGEIKPSETGAAIPPDAAFGTAGNGTGTTGMSTGTAGAATTTVGGSAGTAGVATGTVVAANGTSGTAGGVTPTGTGTASTTPVTLAPPPAPAPAAGADYVVQKGDTLEGIARTKLGDGQKWKSIVDLNPGLNPKALKVGQTIKLPAGGSAGSEIAAKPAAPAGSEAPAGANTYTVQKGDTLIAISRKFFGSDADWKRILEANKSQLKGDAGNLQPGMKLTIPAKR